jgi:signal transduction histidine kinase
MKLSIRSRMTVWYATAVGSIVVLLGLGVFFGVSWSLRHVADMELSSGIDGVTTFLRHKLAIHEMDNLPEELREHSALLPRGKMFRVRSGDGALIFQTDAMQSLPSIAPIAGDTSRHSLIVQGRSYRTFSKPEVVGPYLFLIEVAVEQTSYIEMVNHLAMFLMISIPVAGLLAALGGYWMSGRVLRPIHQITDTASSIDAHNLMRRLPVSGTNDELDRLSETLNHMFDRIQIAYERIAQFTADASHELRTPVAFIRSSAELLLMGPIKDSAKTQGIEDILKESEYMAELIGDLLTLARGDRRDGSLNMELFELIEAVDAILARGQSLAAVKNITIDYSPSSQVVAIYGNRNACERILLIFIDNAIRYTPNGGHVVLNTWISEKTCGFTVSDDGIGIAAEDHQRIFERFYRVDTARTPRDGGTGLGLAIARSLIEAHGGTVSVESQLGQGARFIVRFPRADSIIAQDSKFELPHQPHRRFQA